nr:ribonuclease H-like domain, reverse transcriptase, RNA-dependent DNA polymerase [Tanacetum cinerariifolium]
MHEKFQMSSLGKLTFFLGLQVKQKKDGIFISQDKYLAKVLKKFRFIKVKTVSTPIETQKPLLKDKDGKEVDVHMYRKFLRALHPKWRAKITAIEESKDLTSLSLDELIRNLKVHEMIIKKDSKIVKAKVERKSLVLKAKKESSDEECSIFESEDEEYAMATFQKSRDDKNGKSDRKCFRCGDMNRLIEECPKPPKDKNQRTFFGGSWSDSSEEDDEKVNNETCLVAQASSEICLEVDLEPGEWIKHSGCSKHMTGNRNLFSSYKENNRGNVIFGSNLCGNIIGKEDIKVLKVEIQIGKIAMRDLRMQLKIAQKEKDDIQLNVDKSEHASKSLNKLIECQIVDNCKKGLGYENCNAVPPPYTRNFMPLKPDLSFTGLDEFVNKPIVKNCKAKSSKKETKVVRKNDDALIIKEWVSDNKEDDVSQHKIDKKTIRPSIAKI